MSSDLLRVAGLMQIAAGLLGLISIGEFSLEALFFNVFLIILCLVIIVLGVLVIVKRLIGEAYAAGLLGIFVGGPCLASTLLALASFFVVLVHERF